MTTNIEFATEMIRGHMSVKELKELKKLFSKMDKALYKSYLKELTFNELKEAIENTMPPEGSPYPAGNLIEKP